MKLPASGLRVTSHPCRCGVVALHSDSDVVASVDRALAELRWPFAHYETQDALPGDIDAVVFAASRSAMPALVEHVRELSRSRAGCASLVAGQRFGGEDVAALLDAGASDFVHAPVCPDELAARLRRCMGLGKQVPSEAKQVSPCLRGFIGHSPAFIRQVARLPKLASCDSGVLILGETGTGKEVCAQAIHYLSSRAGRPWVAVNCGVIPLELMESELFGHVKGAYTTAVTAREGLVPEAEGGTLFLDDIDCLPLSAQAKLLRFLQEREYRMVGENRVRHADVRVIAASNQDLAALAARGEFRQDLFFRLNVLPLSLPALRDRREDIPELAAHFAAELAVRHGRGRCSLSPSAMKKLLAHPWPGNVRELQHVIERAVLLAAGPVLAVDDIDIPGVDPADDESFRSAKARVVRQFERCYIEGLLASYAGNITHAAHEAKKNRRAFFQLMRKHHIEASRFRIGP